MVSNPFPLPSRFFPLLSAKVIFSRNSGRIPASFPLFIRAFLASLACMFHRAFLLFPALLPLPPYPPIGAMRRLWAGERLFLGCFTDSLARRP